MGSRKKRGWVKVHFDPASFLYQGDSYSNKNRRPTLKLNDTRFSE